MGTLAVVEPVSLLILATFLVLMVRRGLRAQPPDPRPLRRALIDVGLLAAGAWVAEDTCIRLYDFYQYDAPWRLFLDQMPLLVALIWPFVILSAREVCHALRLVTTDGRPHPLAVGLMVLYDACLVEPVAVRAGLWSWNEPGLFDVPLIGLLGWSFYATMASLLLDRLAGWSRLALVVLAPLATHALLLVTWWGALRWGLRDALPATAAAVASLIVAAVLAARLVREPGPRRSADLAVMAPRMMAAALFFALLFWRGRDVLPLVAYALPFAVPYVLATRFRPTP